MAKKKSTKKTPRTAAAKDEESKTPAAESDASEAAAEPAKEKAPAKAPVKKASKKASKKDDRRPAGAPPADHCDCEWETDTHHVYKLKFKHVGDDNQRKIKILKK